MISDLKKLSPLLTIGEKWKFMGLLGLMLLGAFLEAVGIGSVPVFVAFVVRPSVLSEHSISGRFLPDLPDEPNAAMIIWASVLLLGFTLFKNAFLIGCAYIQARITCGQHARLADRMFRAYQTAPYDWFLQRNTAELQRNILQDTFRVLNGVVLPLLHLGGSFLTSIAIVAVMIVATPGSTMICLGVVGLGVFILTRSLRKVMKRIGETQRTAQRDSIKAIQQGFGAFVDARVLGREDYLAKVHKKSANRYASAETVRQTFNLATPLALETNAIFGLLIILFFLVQADSSLSDSLPVLSVVAVALVRLRQIAVKVSGSVNTINVSRPCIPSLVEDLEELNELEARRREVISTHPLVERFERLDVSGISYTYPNSERPAVDNNSLRLRRGESIAFVGSTGCGKSTLVNCILGLLVPQSGTITVNGIDIRRDPNGWRACLGYIPQSVFLIDDTLRSNIAFGVPPEEIDEKQLFASLESASLAPFIDRLPEGLDTVIGERGVRLSGGQRQRLGIARALYFNPEVLVMDEATSALDNKTEAEVMRAIDYLKRNRTLIMIAHRLSTVEDCDRLYFLDGGKIKDSGTFEELIERSAAFREMAVAPMV